MPRSISEIGWSATEEALNIVYHMINRTIDEAEKHPDE